VNGRRLRLVAALDLREAARRPLFWFWAAVMAGNAWLMSRGNWIYRSVDTSLGSPRAWANSEFQTAFTLPLLAFLLVSFFVAVAAGLPLIRDGERRVRDVLAATPLTTSEYVWGKFAAALGACLAVLATFLGFLLLFTYALPDVANPAIYGPFSLAACLRPFLLLMLPGLVFVAGAAFLLGALTDRPIVVFLLPVVLLPFLQSFVWRWFPADQSAWSAAALRYLDPAGFRWLKETWLRVDRGIDFYNTRPIVYDAAFVASRAAFALLGFLLVELARRHLDRRQPAARPAAARNGAAAMAAASVGDATPAAARRWRRWFHRPAAGMAALGSSAAREASALAGAAATATGPAPSSIPASSPATVAVAPLALLAMRSHPPGAAAGTLTVARFELAEIMAQPGLYIFLPAIVVFLLVDWSGQIGPYDTAVLLTPGTAAVRALFVLMPWLCALLLFYTVESLHRERAVRLAPIYYATPAATSSLVAGKALANLAIVGATLTVSFLAAAWTMVSQGRVHVALGPFLLVWGLLLLPTMLLWIAFVAAAYTLTGNRHLTYGIGLVALIATYWAYLDHHMNWVGNWLLVDAVRWSDLGTFELDRRALWLNRLTALAAVPLLTYLAIRFFRRREPDRLAGAARRPRQRRRVAILTTALAVPPLALGLALLVAVEQGFQGGVAERLHKDYWRQNLATWLDAPLPYVTHVEAAVDIDPARRWFRVDGAYDLVNRRAEALPWYPITGGIAWRNLSWTLDGKPYRPAEREERTGLFVISQPMPAGGTQRLGFRYEGVLLPGVSRNGGEVPLGEFILPSGVLVTARNPDFVPVLGFRPAIGVDDDNRSEPKRFPPDFWRRPLDAEIDRSAFTSRLRITAPAEYTVNSTGVLAGVTTSGGRRTWQWVSDYPLRVWNIAAGRWTVRRGHGTAIYYYPGHPWNVGSMLDALDGARRWYSEWFGPYPWRDLRLNEFPAVADYARGNATNIFFSESAGFLAMPGNVPDLAFAITAHESAHQWWGHILAAGDGPGGIILAEGAAHFSTMLLLEQLRGPASRIAFATGREAAYGETRAPSTEKPLAETTPFRPADETVIYDKGGWVLWMLLHQMGRDAFFAGARHFIAEYHAAPGHPVLQHFAAAMRPYARDPRAFDELMDEWFWKLEVPEYHIVSAHKEHAGTAAGTESTKATAVTDSTKAPAGTDSTSTAAVTDSSAAAAGAWVVIARIANAGTTRMPVEIAAASQGERFTAAGRPAPGYRDVRAILVLGPGEEKEVRLVCPFDPQRLVVDPDANVLQLQRRAATARL
jgi:ABC-2 type transport system permease protein